MKKKIKKSKTKMTEKEKLIFSLEKRVRHYESNIFEYTREYNEKIGRENKKIREAATILKALNRKGK